jgi:putative ABC transport system ATP-binding protein
LANRPTLLLADEPTGALDSAGVEEVLGLLQRLHGEGQTILLVTHDSRVAAAADRVVKMRDGRILDGDAASVPHESGELRVSRMPGAVL